VCGEGEGDQYSIDVTSVLGRRLYVCCNGVVCTRLVCSAHTLRIALKPLLRYSAHRLHGVPSVIVPSSVIADGNAKCSTVTLADRKLQTGPHTHSGASLESAYLGLIDR